MIKERGSSDATDASDCVIYKIDVPANRYDKFWIIVFVYSIRAIYRLSLKSENPSSYIR